MDIDTRRSNLNAVFVRLVDALAKSDVSIEQVTHTDSKLVRGLRIDYRGKRAVNVMVDFGHWIKVKYTFASRYSNNGYSANGDEKEFKRLLNAVKNNLKKAKVKIDSKLVEENDAKDRQSETLNRLIAQGFNSKNIERGIFSFVKLDYKGQEIDVWGDKDIKLDIPQSKLKAVLDLITE